jgi:hypothetical protein
MHDKRCTVRFREWVRLRRDGRKRWRHWRATRVEHTREGNNMIRGQKWSDGRDGEKVTSVRSYGYGNGYAGGDRWLLVRCAVTCYLNFLPRLLLKSVQKSHGCFHESWVRVWSSV